MDESRVERLLDLVQARHIDRSLPAAARICLACSTAINVDGAGVSLVTRVAHRSIAASDDIAAAIERAQVETREGPCLDVHESRRPVMEPDLLSASARRRWPTFSAVALDRGVRAVFGFPLIIDREPIGALDLHSAQAP